MKYIKNKRGKRSQGIAVILVAILILVGGIFLKMAHNKKINDMFNVSVPEYVDIQYIPSGITHSRNGRELKKIKNIVIHYVGNPNTTAQQNRDYFANTGVTVNSHFIIGLDGEVIQCIPLYEQSSASNWRNKDTVSIEVCHPDVTGEFNEETLKSLIKLTAWLCNTCGLDEDDIIRHYDITGKLCPLYFVQSEDAWQDFLIKVKNNL